jgi:hypothetical protein
MNLKNKPDYSQHSQKDKFNKENTVTIYMANIHYSVALSVLLMKFEISLVALYKNTTEMECFCTKGRIFTFISDYVECRMHHRTHTI